MAQSRLTVAGETPRAWEIFLNREATAMRHPRHMDVAYGVQVDSSGLVNALTGDIAGVDDISAIRVSTITKPSPKPAYWVRKPLKLNGSGLGM